MLARYENRCYPDGTVAWVGEYRNLHNISHWHSDAELIECMSGTAVISIGSQTYNLSRGMCAFVYSAQIHHIESTEDAVLLVGNYSPIDSSNLHQGDYFPAYLGNMQKVFHIFSE